MRRKRFGDKCFCLKSVSKLPLSKQKGWSSFLYSFIHFLPCVFSVFIISITIFTQSGMGGFVDIIYAPQRNCFATALRCIYVHQFFACTCMSPDNRDQLCI